MFSFSVDSFFDELTKISANFGFLGPTAQNYAGMLKGLKAGGGSAVERAAYKAQNVTKDMRALAARRAGAPSGVMAAAARPPPTESPILAKVRARNAAAAAAPAGPRYRSEGAGALVVPQTGRAQAILDAARKRGGAVR